MPRRPLLLLLPVLALLAAACGSGGALALDPVAAAATKTQEAKTYAVDFTASMTVQGLDVSFGGKGAVDADANAASLTMDLSGLPLPQSARATAEIVYARGVMYLRMPLLAKGLPGAKPWLKLDLGKVAASRGVDLGALGGADPAQALAQLRAAGDVEKVGTETVQGEETTRYHAVVDPAHAAGLTASQRAALQRALRGTGGSVPVDVWIDRDGHIRRETMTFDYGKALGGARMTMTMNLSRFGEPVSVVVPAADQTVDLVSLLGKTLTP